MSTLDPTASEVSARAEIVQRILEHIEAGQTIRFEPCSDRQEVAMSAANPHGADFCGQIGEFTYQFEGEDDLLHLFVSRTTGLPVAPEEGRMVAQFLLQGVPPGLIWFKPGVLSQHFYVGHDDLVDAIVIR